MQYHIELDLCEISLVGCKKTGFPADSAFLRKDIQVPLTCTQIPQNDLKVPSVAIKKLVNETRKPVFIGDHLDAKEVEFYDEAGHTHLGERFVIVFGSKMYFYEWITRLGIDRLNGEGNTGS